MRTTSPGRFTVFLIGEDQSRLDALTGLLRVVGYEAKVYTNLQAFLDEHDPVAHGCIMLDLSLRGPDDLDLRPRLERRRIQRPIIFLKGREPVAPRMEACKSNAVHFFIEPTNKTAILSAIRAAVKIDSDRLHFNSVAKRLDTLTSRELQVLALVVRGMLNKNIAAALGLREKTIEVNRSRAMKKLGAKSVPHLVRIRRLAEWPT